MVAGASRMPNNSYCFAASKNKYGITAMPTFLVIINGEKRRVLASEKRQKRHFQAKKWTL